MIEVLKNKIYKAVFKILEKELEIEKWSTFIIEVMWRKKSCSREPTKPSCL